MIDGGLMTVIVNKVNPDHLLVTSKDCCEITSRRHMNFPGLILRLPGITEKDKTDFLHGIENGIHYVAASFVRTTDNIKEIREFLDTH